VLALGLMAVPASTLRSAAAAEPAARTVSIEKFAYAPKEITVEPGTKVRWINRDETPQTVTSQAAKKVFASAAMDTTATGSPSRARATSPISAPCIR
jgi:plastocyanin